MLSRNWPIWVPTFGVPCAEIPVPVSAPPQAKLVPPRLLGAGAGSPRPCARYSTHTGPFEKRPLS